MTLGMTRMLQNLSAIFAMRLYDAAGGAAGGGDAGGSGDSGSSGGDSAPNLGNANVPADFMKTALESDPEYQQLIDTQKKAEGGKNEDGSGDGAGDGDGDGGDGSTDGKKGEGSGDGAGDNGDSGKAGKGDQGSDGAGKAGSDSDFSDDIIPGLKGEHFKGVPEEAQLAIAEFYQEHSELKKLHTSIAERIEKAEKDPVIKFRMRQIEEGKSDIEYESPKLTKEEIAVLKSESGLTDEDIQKFDKAINGFVQARVRANTFNHLQREENQRKAEETISKGQSMLLDLGKLNKEIALPAGTKIGDIIEKGEKHPLYEKWKNGIGKVYDWCIKKGLRYDNITEWDPEELYAAAAKTCGFPAAINTQKRDQKMIGDARRKALAPFLKNKSDSDAASTLGAPGSKHGATDNKVVKDGVDLRRLATDDAYLDKQIEKNPTSEEHRKKIYALAEQGRALLVAGKK